MRNNLTFAKLQLTININRCLNMFSICILSFVNVALTIYTALFTGVNYFMTSTLLTYLTCFDKQVSQCIHCPHLRKAPSPRGQGRPSRSTISRPAHQDSHVMESMTLSDLQDYISVSVAIKTRFIYQK